MSLVTVINNGLEQSGFLIGDGLVLTAGHGVFDFSLTSSGDLQLGEPSNLALDFNNYEYSQELNVTAGVISSSAALGAP